MKLIEDQGFPWKITWPYPSSSIGVGSRKRGSKVVDSRVIFSRYRAVVRLWALSQLYNSFLSCVITFALFRHMSSVFGHLRIPSCTCSCVKGFCMESVLIIASVFPLIYPMGIGAGCMKRRVLWPWPWPSASARAKIENHECLNQ